ncbi:phage tail-collar fiber domain-containing protein, partial [Escherichia coli]|uniref:phage tail-collar fiber domain-containing protein n=4 Tax=Enterobacteriaceae TaxID=543 RepID=UPI00215A13D2
LALASLPPSYKPLLAEGSGRQQAVNLWIAVNNTADVRLMTDPAVVIASLGEVDRAKNEAKDYADKIINELDINIQQA